MAWGKNGQKGGAVKEPVEAVKMPTRDGKDQPLGPTTVKLSEATGEAPLKDGDDISREIAEDCDRRHIAGLEKGLSNEASLNYQQDERMAVIEEKIVRHEGVLVTLNDQMASVEKRLKDQAEKFAKLDKLVRGSKAASKDKGHLHGTIDD